jgi:hypothetical protein
MHLFNIIVNSLILLIFSTTAAPTPLAKRGLPGAVYICTDQNFSGDCAWQMPSTQCRIPGTGDLAPESIGPDPGGFCITYVSSTCTGDQVSVIRFPGISSGLPGFGGLKCFKGAFELTNNRLEGAVVGNVKGDARLAGGEGSAEGEKVKKQLKEMRDDGFKEGFIGEKKGLYY